MPLTDAKLRAIKPTANARKIADSHGLQVLVSPNASKLWRFAYRFDGKQKQLALGSYPLVSLAEATQARDVARKQLSPN